MKTLQELKKAFSDPVIHGVFIADFTTALYLLNKKNGPSFWGSFDDRVIARLFNGSGRPLESQGPISSLDEFKTRIIEWCLGVRFKEVNLFVLFKQNMDGIRAKLYFDEEECVTALMATRSSLNRFVFDTIRDASNS